MTKLSAFQVDAPLLVYGDMSQLSSFRKFLAEQKRLGTGILVSLKPTWIDLSLLCHLALEIANYSNREIEFSFRDAKHIRFLHDIGFFQIAKIEWMPTSLKAPTIRPIIKEPPNSLLHCTRLVHRTIPPDTVLRKKAETVGYSAIAQSVCDTFCQQLESTMIWPYLADTDLLDSGEYLSIVLWELIQNAVDHSGGTAVTCAGQLFSDALTPTEELPPAICESMSVQFSLEKQNCISPIKEEWLNRRTRHEYLLIACSDNGMGIPESIKSGIPSEDMALASDSQLLLDAFERSQSLRSSGRYGFDVHGLYTIAELVRLYGGYLFVQSGGAIVEITADSRAATPVDPKSALHGTIFQVLLPLTATLHPIRRLSPASETKPAVQQPIDSIFVVQELRKAGDDIPGKNPQQRAEQLAAVTAAVIRNPNTLYLDLSGMPRERHFLSQLLQSVRKARLHLGPTVIINAESDVFNAISALHSLNAEQNGPTVSQVSDPIAATDQDLSLAISRNAYDAKQPLLVPITSVAKGGKGLRIQWLGVGGLRPDRRNLIIQVLSQLFDDGAPQDASALLRHIQSCGDVKEKELNSILRGVQRSNPGLLSHESASDTWKIHVTHNETFYGSYESIRRSLENAVNDLGLTQPQNKNDLYFLRWRPQKEQYISKFYSVWNVVRDPILATLAAIALLRKAHQLADISHVRGLVSATPSAGLIARELSRILRIPHYECAGADDFDDVDWPICFDHRELLIIDDLIDTGSVSERLIQEVQDNRAGKIVGVLALVASDQGRLRRDSLIPVPVISIVNVSLQRPTDAEIEEALAMQHVLEIDPYTLDPLPQYRTTKKWRKDREPKVSQIRQLAAASVLKFGHFAYFGHHYSLVFDLMALLRDPVMQGELYDWFINTVKSWLESIQLRLPDVEDDTISIVYPYFSPICAFLHDLAPLLIDLPALKNKKIAFHVAKPYKKSQSRTGYSLSNSRASSAKGLSRLVVFIDDGVATGGTLSSIIDEIVGASQDIEQSPQNPTRGILAMVIFDRIGVTPRRHITSIDRYRGGTSFSYTALYSFNLQSFFRSGCGTCKIASQLESFLRSPPHCLVPLIPQLETLAGVLSHVPIQTVATYADESIPEALLTQSDVADVLNARDAIFSDVPGVMSIRLSIDDIGKTAQARLEILNTVLTDAHLFRSFGDTQYLRNRICELLISSPLTALYRCWFVLHLTSIVDEDFAIELLWQDIPEYLCANGNNIAVPTERPADQSSLGFGVQEYQAIDDYFDQHPEVACAFLVALTLLPTRRDSSLAHNFGEDFDLVYAPNFWEVRETVSSLRAGSTNKNKWADALVNTPYQFWFASALPGTDKEAAIRDARMLLCNFMYSFTGHGDSLRLQLKALYGVHSALPFENAFGAHHMRYVCTAIRNVKSYFQLPDELFPAQKLQELELAHSEWLPGNIAVSKERFLDIMRETLVPDIPAFESSTSIHQLLEAISGTVRELYDAVLREFDLDDCQGIVSLREAEPSDTIPWKAHCFGTRDSLVRTLVHLIKNMNRHANAPTAGDTPLLLTVESSEFRMPRVIVPDHDKRGAFIVFSVEGSGEADDAEIENWFARGGGLMAHRQVVQSFGGHLWGTKTGQAHIAFNLLVPMIRET